MVGSFRDAEISPVGGRTDDSITVTLTGGNLPGVFGLAGAIDRYVNKLDVIVVIAVDDDAGLGVVMISEVTRDRQVDARFDKVVTAGTGSIKIEASLRSLNRSAFWTVKEKVPLGVRP